jgi:acetyl-CoA carboxylase biotin carboxyl carrier protein
MALDLIKQIVKLAKDEGVAELKVEAKDLKVEVRFATGPIAPVALAPVAQVPDAPSVPVSAKPIGPDAALHIIKSPFVGTFYSSPGPGKPNYVKLGDKVRAGQALCVLEAMKIMNEIDADLSGEIVEICVENESLVEYGQPLFKIKPH